jgi:DNA-binding transcriptional LysR family regulator
MYCEFTMLDTVELREIRVFLTLAEELHFGRAAERLGITPSYVSQTLRTLEARVGGRLLDRTSRRARLTPLGAQLDTLLRPLYAQTRAAFEAVSDSARDDRGPLRVGVTINTDRPALDHVLQTFRQAQRNRVVTLTEVDLWNPYDALRNGEIDVLCNWLAIEEPDLTAGPVIEWCERMLVVGSAHRLAGRTSVTTEDLADERLNRPPKRYPRALAEAILPSTTSAGRPIPRTDRELESVPEVAAMIARGEIVSINVRGTWRFARDDIMLVPIVDLPSLPLGLIWCTAHENARIRALADIAAANVKLEKLPSPQAASGAPRPGR